jgi:branched-chain amino acid transport system permease protein
VLLVAFPEIFRDFQVYRMLVFGLLLMILMIFRPHGLLAARGRREEEPALSAVVEEAEAAP